MLEGGGQILRNAASLSAISSTAIAVENIRAKRTKPGLRPQHLTGLQLVSTLCNGTLEGGEIGSTKIILRPDTPRCITTTADTGTAGSCMLLAQVAVPCLLYAHSDPSGCTESVLDLKGGTDAAMAPPVGYFQHILLPTLKERFKIEADLELVRRGFFPKGQGIVKLSVTALPAGATLPPINLTDRGHVEEISICAFTAGKLKPSIGERMVKSAVQVVKRRMAEAANWNNGNKVVVKEESIQEPPERAFGDGCGVILIAKTSTGCLIGGSGLGERGVTAEAVGQNAADELMDVLESGAAVDDWLMDQLVVFMALANGESVVVAREPTLHTRTAIAVAEVLTSAKFEIKKPGGKEPTEESSLWLITCQGAGVQMCVN